MSTLIYSVPSISCGHCAGRIQNAVSGVAGVKSVKADPVSKRVEITFDAPASEDKIKAKLVEINHPDVS
jgi:copper chaperone